MPLVDYNSSSSSEDATGGSARRRNSKRENESKALPTAKRQKKLPSLPETFDTGPKDDPSKHQGRRRTRPYVDGEYNAHLYLSLKIPSGFRTVLEDVLSVFQEEVPSHKIHSLLSSLHISLTHPLPLRRHQIDPLRAALADRLRSTRRSFRMSLASEIKVYYNRSTSTNAAASSAALRAEGEGSGGRAFIALRVGAGANELEDILDQIIHPLLEIYHLPKYHENPEFHTSFGWTLLQPTLDRASSEVIPNTMNPDGAAMVSEDTNAFIEETSDVRNEDHIRHSPFTDEMIKRINTVFREKIMDKQPQGGWEVDRVYLKAAKEVHVLHLGV
ncbi:uncharacterized protein I303_102776 [Kwoniella dejecticola CBS 10117]|uniref:U6 snRNA phosphodiesterase 1 n=1 Tax=Kwoniella dejecticola CBS 10117 TaxID=1296121 RepID=A0A1A6A9P1_9TREE|nr:uncharacterized protein I303_02790 [Kwoniella dejecticola CBS 10117]OBR86775.1 hypothetical protein I303_02790 [Kwoniella dejecticola CBS 10117]